jgi:ElaA protein
MQLDWRWYHWTELDTATLYALLRLRSDVFVVEQDCVYLDLDGLDEHCRHLCGRDRHGRLQAYLRLLPPGLKVEHPGIGRVVVAAEARRFGLGRALMREGLRECAQRYPQQRVHISAQQRLEAFYTSLGFRTQSAPYLEDGIWHVAMLTERAA